MTVSRRLIPLVLLGFVYALAACGTDLGGTSDTSSEPTNATDAAVDAGGDAPREDADADDDDDADAADTADARSDGEVFDAADTRSDAAVDTSDDGDADVLVDATVDARDVAIDTDATPDAHVDADTGDVAVDGPADSDAGTDGALDTSADTPTDAFDPIPEGGICGLLQNPGAETGNLDGWTVVEGTFLTVEESSWGGRPAPYEGSRSFAAGDSARSEMVQRIDVGVWSDAIAGGGVPAIFSAQVRDWSGDDEAFLVLRAYDADDGLLAEVRGGPWTAESWTARAIALVLPAGTRSVAGGFRGVRHTGTANDAYFDAASLCLGGSTPGPALSGPPYLMWVTDDAVSVRWESAEPLVGRIEIDHPDGAAEEWVEASSGRTHEIRVEDLEPATTYGYRIVWGGGASDTWTFRTAPTPGTVTPVSFVVWGDNQDGPDMFRSLTPRMAALDPDFAMSTGDCVQNGTRGEYRSQLFAPLEPLTRQVPFLVAAGNHERYSDAAAALFDEYMSQPGDEHCFGWSYGPMFIVFIDTELSISPGSAQDTCIRSALGSPAARAATFRAAAFHKPPRIEFWFGGAIAFTRTMEAPWVRETLEPLLESLDVDVVFNGHNHLYAFTPETDGGITWITTGGAGGMIDSDSFLWRVGTWPEIAVQIHRNHFLHVAVDGDTMRVRAIGSDGVVLDEQVVRAD